MRRGRAASSPARARAAGAAAEPRSSSAPLDAGAHARAARLAVRRGAGTRRGRRAGCTSCRSGSPQSLHAVRAVPRRPRARALRGRPAGSCRETCASTALPATLGAMFEARARRARAPTRARWRSGWRWRATRAASAWQPETHVRIEDFPKLLEDGADGARTFTALDELLRAGVRAAARQQLRARAARDGRRAPAQSDDATRASARTRAWPTSSSDRLPRHVLAGARSCSARAKHARACELLIAARARPRAQRQHGLGRDARLALGRVHAACARALAGARRLAARRHRAAPAAAVDLLGLRLEPGAPVGDAQLAQLRARQRAGVTGTRPTRCRPICSA